MATPNSKIPKELLGRAQNPFSVKNGARQNDDSAGDIRFLPLRVSCLFMWGLFYSLGADHVLLPY